MNKTNSGNFFEDYYIGQIIEHAVPRTITDGDRALYTALYPTRFALYSSDEFARSCGLDRSPLEDIAAFHVVFGKTVPDISLNAIANLGYAEARFIQPVYTGNTLHTVSEVIGLKENSSGKTGVVWVRSTGRNQDGDVVVEYCRWVMVRKRDPNSVAPETVVPELKPALSVEDLAVPQGLNFARYNWALAGEAHRWSDYQSGEVIDHVDAVTVEEAEHMLATRLWQNTAKVHFNTQARPDGKRLVYGGHVISMARALSFNGLANAQLIAGINFGAHANPCFAGTTIHAWSEILERADLGRDDLGALRIRMVAESVPFSSKNLKDDEGKYRPEVLLDLDYWALIPK